MKSAARPLCDVALVHGLLGWLYVAAWAAVHPGTLSAPLVSWLPLRWDTFGAVCFTVSALAHVTRGLLPAGPPWRAPATGRDRTSALLRTVVCYALLLWAYVCVNSLVHPQTLGRPLTHFASAPSEGATATACFALSAVALLVLRARAEISSPGARSTRAEPPGVDDG